MAKKKTAKKPSKPAKRTDPAAVAAEREAVLKSISKRELGRLAGDRTTKQVNEPARRYGLPIFAARVDLYETLAAVWDILTEMYRQDISLETDGLRPRDDLAAVKAQRERLKLLQDEGELVDVNAVRDMLERWASILRQAGEVLDRKFGGEAHLILDEAISDCEKTVGEFLTEVSEVS